MADLSDIIETEAALPASSADDGQSATARPIGDLIQADQFLAAKRAARNRRRGLRFSKIINPGALSDGAIGGDLSFGQPGGL